MLTTFRRKQEKEQENCYSCVLDEFLSTPALTQLVAASAEGQEKDMVCSTTNKTTFERDPPTRMCQF